MSVNDPTPAGATAAPRAGRPSVLAILFSLLVGAVLTYAAMHFMGGRGEPVAAVTTTSSDSKVIEAIEKEHQIVLLSLGVQGIATQETHGTLFGRKVPGSGRELYLQYSYRAKLGIEGGDVDVTRVGENQIRISIPEFTFIGHDAEKFETVVEDNGVLSAVTPEIDTNEMITELLNEDAQLEQLSLNEDLLEDQARAFYEGIVNAVDPDIQVSFEFPRTN